MKNARTRLNETLTYIQNLNLPAVMGPAGIVQAHAFVQHFVNTRFPVIVNDGRNQPMINFSSKMGMGTFYQGNETSPDRQRLRAIFLIKAAIAWHAVPGTDFSAVPLPRTYVNPAAMLADELWKVRLVWGQSIGASTVPHQDLLTYIRNNTLAFMQTNLLSITGTQNQAMAGLGVQADQNVQNFDFQYNATQDRFEFKPAGQGAPGCYTLPVVSLRAQHWTEGAARGNVAQPLAPGPAFTDVHGTELAGANMMVTTQFTGCAFCVQPHGGGVYAAHVVPGALPGPPPLPSIGGALELAQQLCGLRPNVGAVAFANVPAGAPISVYGQLHSNAGGPMAGGYPLGEMYLLGFDAGAGIGGWDIYAQYRNNRVINGLPRKIW